MSELLVKQMRGLTKSYSSLCQISMSSRLALLRIFNYDIMIGEQANIYIYMYCEYQQHSEHSLGGQKNTM